MAKVSKVLRSFQDGHGDVGYVFLCPGCGDHHSLPVGEGSRPRWGFNGNIDKPTFTPSVLVRSGHYASHYDGKRGCWCEWNKQHPEEAAFDCYVCHSFVTDGRIQFLNDCTHALAGQTVDLPEIDPGDPIGELARNIDESVPNNG